MSDPTWSVRLSPQVVKVLTELPEPAREMARDLFDLAARSPWGFTQWDPTDPDGQDVRAASAGQLTVVYWINRPAQRLSVLDLVWLGQD